MFALVLANNFIYIYIYDHASNIVVSAIADEY